MNLLNCFLLSAAGVCRTLTQPSPPNKMELFGPGFQRENFCLGVTVLAPEIKNEDVEDDHPYDFAWWMVCEFSREASCKKGAEISFKFQKKPPTLSLPPNLHVPPK